MTDLLDVEATYSPDDSEWHGDLRYRLLWSLLAETGMRIGEALSLQHRDWNTARSTTATVSVVDRPHPYGIAAKSGLRRIHIGSRLDRLYGDYVWWLVRPRCRRAGRRLGSQLHLLQHAPRTPLCATASRSRLRSPAVPEATTTAAPDRDDAALVSAHSRHRAPACRSTSCRESATRPSKRSNDGRHIRARHRGRRT